MSKNQRYLTIYKFNAKFIATVLKNKFKKEFRCSFLLLLSPLRCLHNSTITYFFIIYFIYVFGLRTNMHENRTVLLGLRLALSEYRLLFALKTACFNPKAANGCPDFGQWAFLEPRLGLCC